MEEAGNQRPRLRDYGDEEVLQLVSQPEVYEQFDDGDLEELVFLALFANGRIEGGAPDFLVQLYRTWQERVSRDRRFFLEAALRDRIQTDKTGPQAFLPMIAGDRDTSVVSTATLDLCCLTPPSTDGDLPGVNLSTQLFESGVVANRTGIFLGLLCTGDRRIMSKIAPLRLQLVRPEIKEICAAVLQFLHGPIVEFLVDWLEEVPQDSGPFGAIAGFLFRLALQHADDGVIELERIFPARIGQRSSIPRGEWTVAEFGQLIAPKLRAICELEEDPKVTPKIMEAWGIEA